MLTQPRSQRFRCLAGGGGGGGGVDEKGLVQCRHVTRNMPNIWEYSVKWFYQNYASRKIIRMKFLWVEAVNGNRVEK